MDDWYYETIITKLCTILSIMDTKEVMKEIHNNNNLAELYFVLNSARDKFQKLQKEGKTSTNETPQYKPHKFGRSGFYKNVDETESEIQQMNRDDLKKHLKNELNLQEEASEILKKEKSITETQLRKQLQKQGLTSVDAKHAVNMIKDCFDVEVYPIMEVIDYRLVHTPLTNEDAKEEER